MSSKEQVRLLIDLQRARRRGDKEQIEQLTKQLNGKF